jgi:hypothetical protein
MQKLVVVFFLVFNFYSFSQTKLIALKSHSGDIHSINSESDGNFGIAPVRLDSVIKISPTCIVEIDNFGRRDTVFKHPTFLNPTISLEELKQQYPRIKFVGFDTNSKKSFPKKAKPHKGCLGWLGFFVCCIGLYVWNKKNYTHLHINQLFHSKNTFFILLLSCVFNTAFGQTKIIAFKSHSGNTANFASCLDTDHFGELPSMKFQTIYDTVKIISDSQFVEVWHISHPQLNSSKESENHFNRDTHLIAPAYRESANEIQNNYPSTTVFQGKVKSKKTKKMKLKSKTKTTHLWFMHLLIGGSVLPYLLHQFSSSKKA